MGRKRNPEVLPGPLAQESGVCHNRCPGCGPVGGDRNSRYCPACVALLRQELRVRRGGCTPQ